MERIVFKITVGVARSESSGIVALDRRRSLGVMDASRLVFACGASRAVDVSEGFARAHFEPTSTHVVRYVDCDLLSKGDVSDSQAAAWHEVKWSDDVSDERLKELWIAAKKS